MQIPLVDIPFSRNQLATTNPTMDKRSFHGFYMKKTRPRNLLESFVVKYDDGRTELIWISIGMLLTNETPLSIARRRQDNGELPVGLIVSALPEHDRSQPPKYRFF